MHVRTLLIIAGLAASLLVGGPGAAHGPEADLGTSAHARPSPDSPPLYQKGEWRLIRNFELPPAAPGAWNGVDWDSFERDGRRYVVGASMSLGLSVFDVTDPADPVHVSDYHAESCKAGTAEYLLYATQQGGAPGVFAQPAGTYLWTGIGLFGAWQNDLAITPDGRLALIGTDAGGRCHDPLWGGVEIVDLTDVANPRPLHLVRTYGMAHSVTIDPERPALAYLSTSDDENYIDILDLTTCLEADPLACRPALVRAPFEEEWTRAAYPPPPVFIQDPTGCHDIRVRGDRLLCAAVGATLMLDTSHLVVDGLLTGTDLAADCPIVDADASAGPEISVTACEAWTTAAFVEAGAEPADLRLVGAVQHGGLGTPLGPAEDISLSHQAEHLPDDRIVFVTDERGGGTNVPCPGGGVWFYSVADEAAPVVMQRPDGSPAVFLMEDYAQAQTCGAHYGAAVPGESLLVIGFYGGGTRVIRYDEDVSTNTIDLEEVAAIQPAGGSAWTSKPLARNPHDPDELIIFTADARGFDVFGVRIPAPDGDPAGAAGGGETSTPAPAALIAVAAVALIAWLRRRNGQ